MAPCRAYIIKVIMFTTGTYVFLDADGTLIASLFFAQENVFKLVHPGIGKKEGWIVGRNE